VQLVDKKRGKLNEAITRKGLLAKEKWGYFGNRK